MRINAARKTVLNAMKLRMAQMRSILLLGAISIALCSESAFAVPGDVNGRPLTFAQVDDNDPINDGGRPIEALPGGGYLALADATKTVRSDGLRYVVEARRIQVRKYSSAGKLNKTFARTQIGRGIQIGKSGEVYDVKGIVRQSYATYLVWAVNEPAAYTGRDESRRKTIVVAFDLSTGKFVRSFGTKGLLQLSGAQGYGLSILADGRIALCGEVHQFRTKPGIPERVAGLVVTASLDAKKFQPFQATGSSSLPFPDDDSTTIRKPCGRITQLASGDVLLTGIASDRITGSNSRIWLAKFTSDGKPVASFGVGGSLTLTSESAALVTTDLVPTRVIEGPDEKLYLAGAGASKARRGFVIRIAPDGKVDPDYGVGGARWISQFYVDDAALSPSGGVLLTGHTRGERPAVGWIDSDGAWNRSLFGHGYRLYPKAFANPLQIVSLNSNVLKVWGWIPLERTARRCGCFPITLSEIAVK